MPDEHERGKVERVDDRRDVGREAVDRRRLRAGSSWRLRWVARFVSSFDHQLQQSTRCQ